VARSIQLLDLKRAEDRQYEVMKGAVTNGLHLFFFGK